MKARVVLVAIVLAGCGGGGGEQVTARPSPTVVDKIGTPPVRDIDSFGGQNLTQADTKAFARRLTAVLRSGDERAFAALFDPRRSAVLARQKVWLRNVRRAPLRLRRVFLVGTTGNIDSSGKQELKADLSFEHQIAGVDRRPVAEWYRYGFRKRDGKLLVTSVRGAAPVATGGYEKFSRYYRQAWDDGDMAVARSGRAVVLGPGADRAVLSGWAAQADEAVRTMSARLSTAGVDLPLAVRDAGWAFTLPAPDVRDFFDYFGGRVDPTEAQFEGFTKPILQTDRVTGEPEGKPVTSRIVLSRSLIGAGDLEETMRHEMVHALLQSQGASGVPTWVVEGAAVYFSASPAERASLRSAGLGWLRSHRRLPSDKVFYTGDDAAVRSHYGAGYLAIGFLVDGEGERHVGSDLGRLYRGDINAPQFQGVPEDAPFAAKVRAWAG